MASPESYLCFVNDGSQDGTWKLIRDLQAQYPCVRGISLSRNFGHQSALLAGLFTDQADVYISIDADLQDDPEKMLDMLRAYRDGADIVYGCRDNRATDTWFKRNTANLFYRLRSVLGCTTIPQHADYRLMSARAVAELRRFGEVNLYLRGIIPMLGFPSTCVYYDRRERKQGESKYPLKKMLMLAWNGIVNFSEVPLQGIVFLGILGILLSAGLLIYSFISWLMGNTQAGWTSLIFTVAFFGSLQLLCLGCIGLYIGKIFKETKRRPLFIVQEDTTRLPE